MLSSTPILAPCRAHRRAAFRYVVGGVSRGVRLGWGWRLEHYTIAHEFGKVCVDDAVALLDGIVAREDVFGIVVANLLQRGVFAVFRFAAGHHRHTGLHIGVFGIATAQNEIAFKRTDAPDACGIAMRTGVCENGVFKRGAVVDAVVRVGGEVESEIRKVVFLLASDGTTGFEVEAAAFVQNLCVFQNAYVPVQSFSFDVRSRLFKFVEDVLETGRCAKVVDEVRLNFLEHGKIADLYAAADILLEDLGDDTLDVCPAVVGSIVLKCLREATATQVLVKLIYKVGGDGFAEEILHPQKLVECEREHFKLKVSSSKLCDKLSTQEIGVGACYEDGMSSFDTKCIDHFLKSLYILDFINEEIGHAGRRRLFVNELFKLIGGLDVFIGTAVKIKIDNVRIVNAVDPHLVGNCFHKAGFSAASDAGYHLYESRVFIKAANLAEVVLSFVVVHGEKYSISAVKRQVKGVKYCSAMEFTPLTRLLESCRTSCRVAFRRVVGGMVRGVRLGRGVVSIEWNKPCIIELRRAGAANVGGGLIKRKALAARDGGGAGHVWPATNRGEHEKQAFGAGFEIAAWRLVFGRKTVGEKHDKRQALIEGGAGDLLLARAYAWRNEHRAALGGIEKARLLRYERIRRYAPRALDLEPIGAVEQEWVAVGGEGIAKEGERVDARKVIGVGEPHRQSAGIVADVAKERVQLPLVGENAVVVAVGEEGGSSHVWPATGRPISGRLALSWPVGRCAIYGTAHGAICLGAAHLEAAHHFAKMAGHAAAHEKQPMEMIGHYGEFKQLHLGVEGRYLPPALDNGFAERRWLYALPHKAAKQRATALYFKRNHVDAALEVIVAEASALHGMLYRAFHSAGIIPNRSQANKEAA